MVKTENVRRCECGTPYETIPSYPGDKTRCPRCADSLAREVEEARKKYDNDRRSAPPPAAKGE